MNSHQPNNIVRLFANENFYGCSTKVIEAIGNNVQTFTQYPDHSQKLLKETIAAKSGVLPSNVVLGVGAVGIIDAITRLFVGDEEEIVCYERSFVGYSELAGLYNKKIHFARLRNFRCTPEAIFSFLNEKTKVIFIANPNNPTGTILSKTELKEILDRVPKHVLVVIDEAYFEYVTDPSFPDTLSLLPNYENLLLLRGFSKIYGLAGYRIGYGISSEPIIKRLENNRVPFSISAASSVAAVAALSDADFITKCAAFNKTEREYLYQGLKDKGYNVLPSQGNFLFMWMDDEEDKEQVYTKLVSKGLMVCNLKIFGQSNSLRIGVGDRMTCDRIIDCLNEK